MPKYEVKLSGPQSHESVIEADSADDAVAKWREQWGVRASVHELSVVELNDESHPAVDTPIVSEVVVVDPPVMEEPTVTTTDDAPEPAPE